MPKERKQREREREREKSNGKLLFAPAITISISIIIIIHSQANVKKSRKNYSAGHILASHLPILPYACISDCNLLYCVKATSIKRLSPQTKQNQKKKKGKENQTEKISKNKHFRWLLIFFSLFLQHFLYSCNKFCPYNSQFTVYVYDTSFW